MMEVLVDGVTIRGCGWCSYGRFYILAKPKYDRDGSVYGKSTITRLEDEMGKIKESIIVFEIITIVTKKVKENTYEVFDLTKIAEKV